MNFSIRGLLLIPICGVALGYWLAPSWFGLVELIGIAILIGALVIPIQDRVTWLSQLRMSLFWIGSGLTLLSILAASSVGFNVFVGWLMFVCLWTTLSGASRELSGSFNRVLLGLLLYAAAGLGLGLGYLGSIYFNF